MTTLTQQTLQEAIHVVGIQVRTNNMKEMSGMGEIGKLWGRFMGENLAAEIPGRIGQILVAVYFDYESDETGDYTFLLGVPANGVDELPTGMSYRRIRAGKYAILMTEKGHVAQVVPLAWQRIWKMTPEELGGHRAFAEDYEVYDHRSADPKNAQVEIHISLQSK